MVINEFEIYRNKKVFVTGHTGFKGSWLVLTLQQLGCEVYGYSLRPDSVPNHFELLKLKIHSTFADIRDYAILKNSIKESQAEIVFHLAAQALVRPSYSNPVYTYDVNVMGSINVLEASRTCDHVKAIVMITTDKVYENLEINYAYKESDRLGGYDMYSSSKACCELLIKSFRDSFRNTNEYQHTHHQLIASVRAGNVIGGGDWSVDRLIPDVMKAAANRTQIVIRNPHSIRPWQHVMDCLGAYLRLGAHLLNGKKEFATTWNVSPDKEEIFSVKNVIDLCKENWGDVQIKIEENEKEPHEAKNLMLDNTASKKNLGWTPFYNTSQSIQMTVQWYKQFYEEKKVISLSQIENYLSN
ncbi:MAG: CDP-glucose 4,6-dehydratase [Saprospiraceae bacterium]